MPNIQKKHYCITIALFCLFFVISCAKQENNLPSVVCFESKVKKEITVNVMTKEFNKIIFSNLGMHEKNKYKFCWVNHYNKIDFDYIKYDAEFSEDTVVVFEGLKDGSRLNGILIFSNYLPKEKFMNGQALNFIKGSKARSKHLACSNINELEKY